MKKISLIIPVYNEEKSVSAIFAKIAAVFVNLKDKYDWEIIFVNDGSSDNSQNEIKKLAESDFRVKFIQFSRNFGKELALTAGLNSTTAEAAIMLDADLQHPPEIIPQFIEKWENGADMVVGVRTATENISKIKRFFSDLFYKIMHKIGEVNIVPHSTDFRLVDRGVIEQFNRFSERSRITRGLLDWLGFEKAYVEFVAPERLHGQSRYSYLKLIKLALSSFVSLSLLPLKLAGYLGILTTFISGLFGVFILINQYFFDKSPFGLYFSGPAQLAVLLIFLVGIILSCMGLMALYIANIQIEVYNRPIYIVKSKKD